MKYCSICGMTEDRIKLHGSICIGCCSALEYYNNWTENELRNGIWQIKNGINCIGPYHNAELLRAELRRRGLSDEGYHNT